MILLRVIVWILYAPLRFTTAVVCRLGWKLAGFDRRTMGALGFLTAIAFAAYRVAIIVTDAALPVVWRIFLVLLTLGGIWIYWFFGQGWLQRYATAGGSLRVAADRRQAFLLVSGAFFDNNVGWALVDFFHGEVYIPPAAFFCIGVCALTGDDDNQRGIPWPVQLQTWWTSRQLAPARADA